jgi:hypothetical protein
MDVSAIEGFRQRPRWLLVLVMLFALQSWLTLRLFTPDFSFDRLLNDEPVLSGKHPLHYYHGSIGARTWLERGTNCCYDPTYQAGYPKTPIFDSGSRPAELCQVFGGRRPATYKIFLAVICLLVPGAFALMARGIGLPVPTSCLAGLLGMALFWSGPNRALLEAGDLDMFLGGMCLLIHVAWLIRFERMPGLDSWCVMTVAVALAWFTQPLLVVGYMPLLVLYYFWVAMRQGLIWHLALVAAIGIAFGMNAAWLRDWVRYLWIYLPFGGDMPASFAPIGSALVQHWPMLLPNDLVYIGISGVGLLGLLWMLGNNRAAAWLLGLGTLGYTVVGAAGKLWPALAEFGTEKLLLMGGWCLVCPAAALLARLAIHFGRGSGFIPVAPIWLLATLGGLAWSAHFPQDCYLRPGLEIGWNPERQEIIRLLRESTTAEARILWEDRQNPACNAGWTAMLASTTDRALLGGLDPAGRLEHMFARLCDGKLAGKPIAHWSDAELKQFTDRYNVSWVVCWSAQSVERFRQLPWARPVSTIHDGETGVFFELTRKPSYFLKGKGEWIQADWQRVALANVVPENGEVIISLHYQSNWRVSPVYVQLEEYVDLDDPRPLLRIRIPGPVHRLTLVWENP